MKYENQNPIEKLHEGEPYFFIRAQDKHAEDIVKDYARKLRSDDDHHGYESCMSVARKIKAWQDDNPSKVKRRVHPSELT